MKVKILKSYLYAFVWIVVLVAADQFTKWLAVVNLKNQDSFILIPDIFELQYLENRGAAFGMFQGKQFLFTI